MKRVWKYQIGLFTKAAHCAMPIGARVVHFAPQGDDLMFWAEVDDSAPESQRKFVVFRTGHVIPGNASYVATTVDGDFVWHLYEVTHV